MTANRREELLDSFLKLDKSIKDHSPQCDHDVWVDYATDDIFYNQLMYVLKGEAKFSSSVICDPNTTDLVWIILRTLGLFIDDPENKARFDDLKRDLFKSYMDSNITESKVCNILYMLGYSELIDLCPNSFIDKDDLLHFMLVFVYNPQLIQGD